MVGCIPAEVGGNVFDEKIKIQTKKNEFSSFLKYISFLIKKKNVVVL